LYDRLADRFGEDQVFIDVDTIEPGIDFAAEISRAVAGCKVLLAVIGPGWLDAADQRGRRRLDDPDDIVRLEIKAALARDVRVIPILVEGAVMPGRQDLPESLAGLPRRNAFLIRHESFRSDAGRLVTAIERALAAVPKTATGPIASQGHAVPPGRAAVLVEASDGVDSGLGGRMLACSSLTAGHLEVFVLDQVGRLRHRWYWTDEDWSGWHDIPAPPTERITAIGAGSHSDRQQEFIAAGADGSIHHRWNFLGEDKSSQWSDWHSF